MPAVAKPFTLQPAQAQAANASAPAMVAQTAAQAPSGVASSGAVAAAATRPMWAPLTETVVEDEALRQALNAIEGRRIASLYERKSESVTSMEAIEQENRQSLTLLPGSGSVSL